MRLAPAYLKVARRKGGLPGEAAAFDAFGSERGSATGRACSAAYLVTRTSVCRKARAGS
jgi:hypothetical protein